MHKMNDYEIFALALLGDEIGTHDEIFESGMSHDMESFFGKVHHRVAVEVQRCVQDGTDTGEFFEMTEDFIIVRIE